MLLSLRKEGRLIHASTYMGLEDSMLSDINESQKDKGCVSLRIWSPDGSQTHRDGRWNGGCWGRGAGEFIGH